MNVIFVTGNLNKARLFSELVGMNIDHEPADVEEVQSLDLSKVAIHKAKDAYRQLKRPVIVEDAGVSIRALGKLPGPFIKWFVDEIGLEKICRLADADHERVAIASDVFAYFDGKDVKYFQGDLKGTIAPHPKGEGGWDWDKIFIPDGSDLTLGEMNEVTYTKYHLMIKPMSQMKDFLKQLDSRKA